MIQTLRDIIVAAFERLSQQMKNDLPPLLAAIAILAGALVMARLARWLVTRLFKGIEVDNWLRRSGLSGVIDRRGTMRASRVAAQTVFWGIVVLGCITALNVFGTSMTLRLAEAVLLLLPRIVAAAVILLGGLWLGHYLARGALIWAVNDGIPSPRLIAMGVRLLVVFTAIVVAAHTIDFASRVFLAGFILILGGAVLAVSLAIGLGARDAVRRHFEMRSVREKESEEDHLGEHSLWNHL